MPLSDKNKGILLCLLSSLVIASQDAISKELLRHFSIAQIIFLRQIVFVLFSFWWVARHDGWRGYLAAFAATKGMKMQITRSVLMVVEIGVFFWGLRYIGIAKAHSIFMLFPILATLIAVIWLREKMTRIIGIALAIGFAGALLIIRPGGGGFQPESLIILLAAFLFATYNVVTRFATARDGFVVSMVYMGLVGMLVSAPFGVYFWQHSSDPKHWLLLGALTLTGITAHLLIVKSLEYAQASVLQPYNYAIVVWAILLGWIFFGEVLDGLHFAGIAAIFFSGLLVIGDIRLHIINRFRRR